MICAHVLRTQTEAQQWVLLSFLAQVFETSEADIMLFLHLMKTPVVRRTDSGTLTLLVSAWELHLQFTVLYKLSRRPNSRPVLRSVQHLSDQSLVFWESFLGQSFHTNTDR